MKNTIQTICGLMREMKIETLEVSKVNLRELQKKYKADYLATWNYDFNNSKVKNLVQIYDLVYTFKKASKGSVVERMDVFKDFNEYDKVEIEIFYNSIVKIASKEVEKSTKHLDDVIQELLVAIKNFNDEKTKSILLSLLDIEFNDNDISRLKDVIVKGRLTTFSRKELATFIYELCKAKLDYAGLYSVKKASVEIGKITKEVGFIDYDTSRLKDLTDIMTVYNKMGISYDPKTIDFKVEKPKAKDYIDTGKIAVIPECLTKFFEQEQQEVEQEQQEVEQEQQEVEQEQQEQVEKAKNKVQDVIEKRKRNKNTNKTK